LTVTTRPLAQRLLLPEVPPSSANRIQGTDEKFVVTALLKRRRGTSVRVFTNTLMNGVGPALLSRRDDWNIAGVRIMGAASLSRPLVFFFELTRTFAVASRLCRIAGHPVPEPYRLKLTPLYDALLELQFTEPPGPAVIQGVRAVLEEAGTFDATALLGSGFQVRVYDASSPSDVMNRVDICFLVNRPPGMTRDACQLYWRTQHAELALANMRYLNLTRYRQVHTLETPPAGLDDLYDGVVYAEKSSFARLLRDVLTPSSALFNNTVVVDECNFTHATPVMLMRLLRAWEASC
jgi:hypothetical protein